MIPDAYCPRCAGTTHEVVDADMPRHMARTLFCDGCGMACSACDCEPGIVVDPPPREPAVIEWRSDRGEGIGFDSSPLMRSIGRQVSSGRSPDLVIADATETKPAQSRATAKAGKPKSKRR